MTTSSADRVAEAMRVVDRADFLPAKWRDYAEQDRPLPLAQGSTNSQPSTVRRMLTELDVVPGARVLDVGSGSGWTTAILGHLTGPGGVVLGLDVTDFLVDFGQQAIAGYEQPWVQIELADPTVFGTPGRTWDRILVSADAGEVPAALTAQLADGARMVLPAAGQMTVVDKVDGGLRTRTLAGAWSFVKLR